MDRKKINVKILFIKIFCILISFILWVYIVITLDPVITTKINNIPVDIINSNVIKNNGLTLLLDEELFVNLTVEGKAKDIYSLKPSNFEVYIDLAMHDLNKGENIIRSYQRNIPANIRIKSLEELDVKLVLDDYVEKRVLVDKNIETKDLDGFYSFDPVITPEHVVVSGAAKYVNQIDKVLIEGEFKDLTQDVYKTFPIKVFDKEGNELNKFLDINPLNVELYLRVRAIKDVEVNTPFINSLPEGLFMESTDIIPKNLQITGESSILSGIYKISTDNIDLSKIEANSILEVPLKLPNGVEVVDNIKSVKVKIRVNGEKIE